tara:strand:+ start:1059 stop:1412 length:354 start_codon:yes stop_codon:yes gene_type:complete
MITQHIFKKSDGSLIFSSDGTIPPEFQSEDYIHKVDDTLDMQYDYKWDSAKEEIVKGELRTVDPAIIEEQAKLAYRGSRRDMYPDIGDQLDDLYKQGAFSTEMAAKIKAVKDKYPKG